MQTVYEDNLENHYAIIFCVVRDGIKTVPHTANSPELSPWDIWLFLKLKKNVKGSCFIDIEKKGEAMTRTLDTFNLYDFHKVFMK